MLGGGEKKGGLDPSLAVGSDFFFPLRPQSQERPDPQVTGFDPDYCQVTSRPVDLQGRRTAGGRES